MLALAIIICIVFLLFAQRIVYRRLWYKELHVDISFEQRRVIEREPIRLIMKLENRKNYHCPHYLWIYHCQQSLVR